MTVLFYLNNVTGGGETVFPVADNRTYDEMVRAVGLFLRGGRAARTPFWTWDAGAPGCVPAGELGAARTAGTRKTSSPVAHRA